MHACIHPVSISTAPMMHCRHRFKVSAILENACSVREWALLSTHLMRGREHTVSAEGMLAVRTLL